MPYRTYIPGLEQDLHCYKCHRITLHKMIPKYHKCQECGMERDVPYVDPTSRDFLVTPKMIKAREVRDMHERNLIKNKKRRLGR